MVLVEDMPLELIQFLICIVADLTRVSTTDLDPHVLGTFKSAVFDMLLRVSLGPKRLLAARALLITRSILLWIVQSLLSELLFTSSSVLRLVGVH